MVRVGDDFYMTASSFNCIPGLPILHSKDMVNWTDWTGDNLIEPSEPYDELYAHKSFVLKHKGVVYHYYCAVNKKEQRGIAVATSKDLGKSNINFINSTK